MAIADLYRQVVIRYSYGLRRTAKRLILMLPGAGCSWYKDHGGCTMCGFNESVLKYGRGLLLPDRLFRLMYHLAAEKNCHADQLAIFNGGSFLNPREMPASFQYWLFRKAGEDASISELFVESRCEYVDGKSIASAVKLLNGKKLIVAVGLESQDDHVRNSLIRKGLSKESFERTIEVLLSAGAAPYAYVFLKPVGLEEREAKEETLATIRYALAAGAKEVELSSAFVQKGTFMDSMHKKGRFRPPWLWTIVDIVKEAASEHWPLYVGRFTDEPEPVAIPKNCPKCSSTVAAAIEEFRQRGVLGELPDCSCRADWLSLMRAK